MERPAFPTACILNQQLLTEPSPATLLLSPAQFNLRPQLIITKSPEKLICQLLLWQERNKPELASSHVDEMLEALMPPRPGSRHPHSPSNLPRRK